MDILFTPAQIKDGSIILKKHFHIPLNTSEAEYMALCNAWRHVKWLRNVPTAMGFGWMAAKATRIIGDNQNATNWAVEKM